MSDTLFPWEFPNREANIYHFKTVTSTMDIARELARQGCPDFTVVIAESQEKGRGRLKRIWMSLEGGLYFTLVLRPEIPAIHSYKINFCASLCLVRVIRELTNIDVRVKWPNDMLAGDKKIMGMLSEMEADAGSVSFINIGIGINVNNDPSVEEPKATSLKNILEREIPRKEILSRFLDAFEMRVRHIESENVISQWKQYAMPPDRHVKIVTENEVCEGMARDVDDDGALVLELADGTIRKVIYGDCFYQS